MRLHLETLIVSAAIVAPAIAQVVTRGPDLMLPPQISGHEFDRYSSTLALTDAERELALAFLEEYRDAVADEDAAIEELARSAKDVQSLRRRGDIASCSYADAYADWVAQRNAIADRLMDAEETFFATLGLLLDDERLPRVRLIRVQRLAVWSQQIRASMPGVTIDVADRIWRTAQNTLEDTSEIEALLNAYSDRLGPALRSRLHGAIDVKVRDLQILSERHFTDDDQPRALSQEERVRADIEMLEARRRLYTRQAKRDARVRDLDESLLLDAVRIFPRSTGRSLELAVLPMLVTEPNVYPDSSALDEVFTRLIVSEQFTEDQIATFSRLYDEYLRLWRSIDRDLREEYKNWIEKAAAEQAYHIHERNEYLDTLNEHLERRSSLNERYARMLSSLLSESQRREFGLTQPNL